MSFAHRIARSFAAALTVALICCLGCMPLAGCSQQLVPQPATEEEQGATSRSFMAELNGASDELQEKMAAFTDAVARQDLVSMRMQADAAYAVIDQMAAIEAPDDLKELQQKYVDGCTQLKDALTGYMDLYGEINSSTIYRPFDYDTYPERIAQLQVIYDGAVQALQDADQTASEM